MVLVLLISKCVLHLRSNRECEPLESVDQERRNLDEYTAAYRGKIRTILGAVNYTSEAGSLALSRCHRRHRLKASCDCSMKPYATEALPVQEAQPYNKKQRRKRGEREKKS